MAFKIQSGGGILEKLTQWVSTSTDKITDFNVGSATRTLLESVALQIEEFYYDLKRAVEYAVKNSCYQAFGFERYKATKATGMVTIFFDKPLNGDKIFEKGTKFHTGKSRTERIYFESTQTIIAKKGAEIITIPVECTESGEVGNVKIGEINKLEVGSPIVKEVINKFDFVDGKNVETLTDRSVRFREYITSLQRGTVDAIAYGIKQVPGVAGVSIDDTNYGIVYAYVHDKNGDLSEELKEKVLKNLINYRSGGIEISIKPMIKRYVDLELEVFYKDNVDGRIYDEILKDIIEGYLNNLKASENLHLSNLITFINDTYRDVISYINIKDSEDVIIAKNEIIRAGTVKVN